MREYHFSISKIITSFLEKGMAILEQETDTVKSSFRVFFIEGNLPATGEVKKIIKNQPLLQACGH